MTETVTKNKKERVRRSRERMKLHTTEAPPGTASSEPPLSPPLAIVDEPRAGGGGAGLELLRLSLLSVPVRMVPFLFGDRINAGKTAQRQGDGTPKGATLQQLQFDETARRQPLLKFYFARDSDSRFFAKKFRRPPQNFFKKR